MSGLADIDQLLHPTLIDSLRESMPPVSIRIWRSGDEFDDLELTLYPFDTLDTLKRSISLANKEDPHFLPSFLFVGIEHEKGTYLPLEYVWYPPGTQRASRMIYLPDPRDAVKTPVKEFVVRGGGAPSPAANPRGRSTIEDIFKGDDVPTLYVFPLHRLLRAYKGVIPMGEAEWYQRFYPYFPAVSPRGPYKATKEDERFGKTFMAYLDKRATYLKRINRLIEGNVPLPELKVTGVKQLRLELQIPDDDFEDCETLFFNAKVTDARPYMRLLPADGMPVSKVLVKGLLPIPALDNPDVIQQWAKEVNPTMGKDYLMIKYVHRPSIGTTCPIYGTIRIFDDGTADLLLQPPKNIKKLEPVFDFRHFSTTLEAACKKLPIDVGSFDIGEAALIFQLETEPKAPKFTKASLKKRLPFFGAFFQEIAPLKDQPSLISLRYKAISQYASEDNLFAFLTQYSTSKKLEGEALNAEMLAALQEEFQLSALDGRRVIDNWLEKGGTLSVTVPEENEFMETFNPGIDVHVYAQHPFYTFHVHRIDSYQTFQRIYTLLALMFSEEEERFTTTEKGATAFATLSAKVEASTLAQERGLKEVGEEGEEAPEPAKSRLRSFARDEEEEDEPVKTKLKAIKEKPDVDALINPKGWLIDKLKKLDNPLFDYKPTVKDTQYSRACQAQDDKQPAALEPDQFRRMLTEYKPEIDAGEIFFNVYPLEKGQKEPVAGVGSILADATEIVVSRYGSDATKENYYFCPELFCLRDEIMILEKDFDAEEDREGNEKDKFTCPFCKGTEIDGSKAVRNATVLRREPKKAGEDAPLFVGFTKRTTHPDNYALPCCHIKKKTWRIMQPGFERLRTIVKKRDESITLPVEEVSAERVAAEEEVAERSRAETIRLESTAYKTTVNYALKFESLDKEYIVDAVKHPLEPGKFAMLPTVFDTYFAQKSDGFVKRVGIRQELKATSAGFLRVGTQIGALSAKCGTAPRPMESLLGVLAPLLYKNSIEDVRELILKCVTGPGGVEIFVNANFGNLVNEFYDPADPDLGVLRDDRNYSDLPSDTKGMNVHVRWAKTHLRVTPSDDNQYAINRIYKSWNRFQSFMKDTTKRKELRHLTSFLTEPLLLTSNKRGLQVVLLEWTPGSDAPVQVKCGPYGFSSNHHRNNDFAFVWRDDQGFYELILYTKNDGDEDSHEYTLRWKHSNRTAWPRIVQDRVQEYMKQCKSTYRSIYTPQSGIDPMALIPLSQALETPIRMGGSEVYASGIIRDTYNHAVMVLYPLDPEDEDAPHVPVPVVDDGKLPLAEQLVLDLNDIEPAPIDQMIAFYETHMRDTFPLYPGYAVKSIATKLNDKGKEKIKGIQLQNGVLVPGAKAAEGADLSRYERKSMKVIEWEINRQLSRPCGEPEIKDSDTKKLDELYQYFRFMVSNWLAKDAGPAVRKDIERIVFSRSLPEFEKRKRLEILCGNFVRGEDSDDGWLGWMAPDDKDWDMPGGLLRKDCRVLDKGSCSEPCVWRADKGVCALHVTEEAELGQRTVNTRILFSRRVIDELIRFPNRRKELLEQGVRHMSALAEPIRKGDQYIIPEKGTSWLNLLRLDWMTSDKEIPRFYEEMSSEGVEEEEGEEGLPAALKAIVGTSYQLYKGDLESILGITFSELGSRVDDPVLSTAALQAFVKKTGKPIGVVNVMDGDVKFLRPKGDFDEVTVIVFLEDGMALLVEDPSRPYVAVSSLSRKMKVAWEEAMPKPTKLLRRSISFAPNTKPPAPSPKKKVEQTPKISAVPLSKKTLKRKSVEEDVPLAPKKTLKRVSAIEEEEEESKEEESAETTAAAEAAAQAAASKFLSRLSVKAPLVKADSVKAASILPELSVKPASTAVEPESEEESEEEESAEEESVKPEAPSVKAQLPSVKADLAKPVSVAVEPESEEEDSVEAELPAAPAELPPPPAPVELPAAPVELPPPPAPVELAPPPAPVELPPAPVELAAPAVEPKVASLAPKVASLAPKVASLAPKVASTKVASKAASKASPLASASPQEQLAAKPPSVNVKPLVSSKKAPSANIKSRAPSAPPPPVEVKKPNAPGASTKKSKAAKLLTLND